MKLMMFMIIFAFAVLVTTSLTESTEIDKNSILIKNIIEDNTDDHHNSQIQKRSLLRVFGLKQQYRPLQYSINWRKSNQQQQRFTKTKYNRLNHEITNTRPISFLHIQKNYFFYNGLNNNQANHPSHNPEIINVSTTPKYVTTTAGNILGNKPTSTMTTEDTFSMSSMQQTESTLPTRFVPSTEVAPATQNVEKTKTTQIYQIMTTPRTSKPQTTQIYEMTTPRTSKPQTEKPINVITTQFIQMTTPRTSKPQTEKLINVITTTEGTINNKVSSKINDSVKGGFTSTSMTDVNQYSELIYAIDPRYRKR